MQLHTNTCIKYVFAHHYFLYIRKQNSSGDGDKAETINRIVIFFECNDFNRK